MTVKGWNVLVPVTFLVVVGIFSHVRRKSNYVTIRPLFSYQLSDWCEKCDNLAHSTPDIINYEYNFSKMPLKVGKFITQNETWFFEFWIFWEKSLQNERRSAICSLNVNKVSRIFSGFFFVKMKVKPNTVICCVLRLKTLLQTVRKRWKNYCFYGTFTLVFYLTIAKKNFPLAFLELATTMFLPGNAWDWPC